MDDKEKALIYLKKDYLANINIVEPILRGTADILAVSDKGVLAYERKAELHLISSETEEAGIELLKVLETAEIFNVGRNAPLEYLMNKYGFNTAIECYQCAYLGDKKIFKDSKIDISVAKEEELSIIVETYKKETAEGIREIWESGEVFSGYYKGEMVGFAGVHLEGTLGFLEIFHPFRGKGYGAALEAYVINYLMEKGHIPYGHVILGNELSLKIQKRIGFQFSEENIFWTFFKKE